MVQINNRKSNIGFEEERLLWPSNNNRKITQKKNLKMTTQDIKQAASSAAHHLQ